MPGNGSHADRTGTPLAAVVVVTDAPDGNGPDDGATSRHDPADEADGVDRRTLLQAGGAVAVLGAGVAGWRTLLYDPTDANAQELDDEESRGLAEAYAPTLYFDVAERWYPTDPRPYERDDDPVVDGFTALNDYTAAFETSDDPPAPTVFYRALAYEDSPLAVVQFWLYSAFDQFTTNFHWHDWEVVHVFVDRDSDEPQLFVASAHSRKVPNNEYLDPEPDAVPRVLPELGSHSSGLSVNEVEDRFQRVSLDDVAADITNAEIAGVTSLSELRAAYGLPRDEGSRLPFAIPELDGAPLYEHERLPDVTRESLITDPHTVRSFGELSSPPDDLPERETGLSFGPPAAEDGVDVAYDLVATSELEHITTFDGPQLSFEFRIPAVVEDQVAGHITTTGVPWDQPRYDNPALDISDPAHRAALADRYDAIARPSGGDRVVAAIGQAVESAEAPDGEGLTTEPAPIEGVALLESDPVAVPTFRGVAIVRDVPAGEHRLTVEGAGLAPHSETVGVESGGDPTVAGVEGEIPLVARGDAVKLEVDPEGTDADLERLAVEDDFAGRLYDAPLLGPDAVYVHRGGAYATEVEDAEGELGAFRVSPDPAADPGTRLTVDEPRTGKAPLAEFQADVAGEAAADVRAVAGGGEGDDGDSGEGDGDDDGDTDDTDDDTGQGNDGAQGDGNATTTAGTTTTTAETTTTGGADGGGNDGTPPGLARVLEAAAESARRAAEQAAAGNGEGADRRLETVRERLERARSRLEAARDDLPDDVAAAVDRRTEQAQRRNEQALASDKP